MDVRSTIKKTSNILAFQLVGVVLGLLLIPLNIKSFGVDLWSQYQFVYILIIGSFNWMGGLPISFNRLFSINYKRQGFNILLNSFFITFVYSITLLIVVLGLFNSIIQSISPLEMFFCLFFYNTYVIGRNALEVLDKYTTASIFRFALQMSILLIPLISGQLNFGNISILLLVINILQFAIVLPNVSSEKVWGLQNIYRLVYDGFGAFQYTVLNQSYLMAVPFFVQINYGITTFRYFMPIYELTSKSGAIGNALNSVIAPSISKGTLTKNVFSKRNNLIFILVLATGFIVAYTTSYWVQEYYLKLKYSIEVNTVYILLLLTFLSMSINAIFTRAIVANGEVKRIIRGSWGIYLSAMLILWYLRDLEMFLIVLLLRSYIEFIHLKRFVR